MANDAFEAEVNVRLDASEEEEVRQACQRQLVENVPAAFADLPRGGSKLKIHTRGTFPDRRSYTQTRRNFGGNENHFQGCQRLLASSYFAFTGGDWRNRSSHLFIAQLGSRARRKWWGTDVERDGPPDTDRAVLRLDLHEQMWHSGGIDLCGHILAVALLHVPGEGYVAAVLSAAEKREGFRDKRIDFYRTDGDSLSDGFLSPSTLTIPESLKWSDYQAINFVRERDGRVFLVGLGADLADLFQVALPTAESAPELTFFARHRFRLDRAFAEFKAGAGIYTCDGALGLYGLPQWRLWNGQLYLSEWAAEE